MLLLWILCFLCGAVCGRLLLARWEPSRQERIDAIVKSVTPLQAEDFVKLLGAGVLCFKEEYTWKYGTVFGVGGFFLYYEGPLTKIKTPSRKTILEVIPDMERFQAAVLAAETAND